MKKSLLILLLPVLLLVACDSSEDVCLDIELAKSDIFSDDAYRIIESIIKYNFKDADLTHISQETHSISDSARFATYFRSDKIEYEHEMIKEYIEINNEPFIWGDSFDAKQKLLSSEELTCLSEIDSWFGFFVKYPNSSGYLKFGRPVINDQNEALITFDLLCGPLCSLGYTATLRKQNDTWIVSDFINVWIS